MAELTDHEARELAGAFHRHKRPMLFAVLLNLSMGVLLLGVPYVRGRILARAKRDQFVAVMHCVIGGQVAPVPGLSLPRGEREHYAERVLFAEPSWPASCRPALDQLRAPNATFLWPSLKTAGVDLNAAVDLVDKELLELAAQRKKGSGRVPARPLQALRRLQAASVLYARAGDAGRNLDNDGIVLVDSSHNSLGSPKLATPARLPLMLGDTRALEAWSEAGVLELLTLDAHSLAYLHADNGKVEHQRLRRNAYLRGVVRAESTPYLVWSMPATRCAEAAERCVDRPTGLARFDRGSSVLGEPTWKLPGHLAERVDRSLSVSVTGRVDLLALKNPAGGVELRRVRLPATEPTAADGTEPKTLELNGSWPIIEAAETASVSLVQGEPLAVLRASDTPEGVTAAVSVIGDAAAPVTTLPLETAAGSGAWAVTCTSEGRRHLAYGSSSELRIAALSDGPSIAQRHAQSVQLERPLDAEDRARDRVRLECAAEQARLFFLDQAHVLWQVDCAANSCQPARELVREVAQFSVVQRGARSVVAFHSGPSAPVIRVLRLDEHGAPLAPPSVVASCWDPLGGMCGVANLVGDKERVVLLARDGPDMLALETGNEGYSFSSLSGFGTSRSTTRDATAPLQQHRQRKGID